MTRKAFILTPLFCIGLSFALVGLGLISPAKAADAYIRVVDVGAGLCVIARTPDDRSMVYDTGLGGTECRDAVREIIPNHEIDLLVLSHSDADHIGGAVTILRENRVRQILHSGDNRPIGPKKARTVLGKVRDAIAAEPGATEINLATANVRPGHEFDLGDAKATFIAGWSEGNGARSDSEAKLHGSHMNNALSIVLRFEYSGHSILLTGDTVGRMEKTPVDTCKYSEARMVENVSRVPIRSDILIGQHHGADNASATCFISAVRPTYVVFGAGSHQSYKHPWARTAKRFMDAGILPDNIYRTDFRDAEGKPEWNYKSLRGCDDKKGDDDVEIWLSDNANVLPRVRYRYTQQKGCHSRP